MSSLRSIEERVDILTDRFDESIKFVSEAGKHLAVAEKTIEHLEETVKAVRSEMAALDDKLSTGISILDGKLLGDDKREGEIPKLAKKVHRLETDRTRILAVLAFVSFQISFVLFLLKVYEAFFKR